MGMSERQPLNREANHWLQEFILAIEGAYGVRLTTSQAVEAASRFAVAKAQHDPNREMLYLLQTLWLIDGEQEATLRAKWEAELDAVRAAFWRKPSAEMQRQVGPPSDAKTDQDDRQDIDRLDDDGGPSAETA
jgi:hypothetical protein